MAFRTLVRLTAPPAPLHIVQPLLRSTLMELVYVRLHNPSPGRASGMVAPKVTMQAVEDQSSAPSEQATYTLAMVDALTVLPEHETELWLNVTADSLSAVLGENQKTMCRARFWEILSSGELNSERAAIAITWWTTKGGRDMVMHGVKEHARPPI